MGRARLHVATFTTICVYCTEVTRISIWVKIKQQSRREQPYEYLSIYRLADQFSPGFQARLDSQQQAVPVWLYACNRLFDFWLCHGCPVEPTLQCFGEAPERQTKSLTSFISAKKKGKEIAHRFFEFFQ